MIFNRWPGSDPLGGLRGWGQKVKFSFFFSEYGHVAYQIKGNHVCSKIVANILPADPTLPPTQPLLIPEGWFNRSKSTFTEHVHVAYQIKWSHECSNMVVNILSADLPPRPWGQKVEIQLFQNMVMLHIKLNEITNATTW